MDLMCVTCKLECLQKADHRDETFGSKDVRRLLQLDFFDQHGVVTRNDIIVSRRTVYKAISFVIDVKTVMLFYQL